jgi:nitrogen fixation NifU-like protein
MMDRQAAIDQLLDHYHNPRNRGVLAGASFEAEGINPGCGDVIHLYVRLDAEDRVTGLTFDGHGCTISQAAASMTTDIALGKTLDDLLEMDHETLFEVLGRDVVINRVKCATLALDALKQGGRTFRNGG